MNKNISNLETLFELASLLREQSDFQEILRLVTTKISTMLNADFVSIVMIHPRTQETIKTIIREEKKDNHKNYHLVQTNVIGWTRMNDQFFLSQDISSDSRFRTGLFSNTSISSVMCIPLVSEGSSIGYISVMNNKRNKTFSEENLGLLQKVSLMSSPYLSNLQKIEEFFKAPLPEGSLLSKYKSFGLLGRSQPFLDLLRAIEAAAKCDVRVLLVGESGTGKELIARALHRLSSRKDFTFVTIDCGVIPENLIESELFGHVKGAFTGATSDRTGLFEEAHQGTIFMDEISNLPYDMQSKLLRVLQEGEIRILGSNRVREVDVRIISASSYSLHKMVNEKQFREDLFYRLNVYPIIIPTLRERREDVELLANYFLEQLTKKYGKEIQGFEVDTLSYFLAYNWPGNIRELENVVERMVIRAGDKSDYIPPELLPEEIRVQEIDIAKANDLAPSTDKLKSKIETYEKRLLMEALNKHHWNQSAAARELGIHEKTIREKIQKLNINKPI
jgi:transcriptional regulator with GAF, ATPase, and Fis domain